ncbi:hypothetical protein CONLIGDRAFT_43096 [Coniochaeta ligniaria NRRL 30616]|uniref:Uncharacterized protein n=1 Tax=Coniochaeta ligniaria NRRL 30616 TaxID=1408157 RepID=A0A1J7J6P5_9PEZI|nr:hypothetical protein CONLIGDRAFT_43096 [Coniochaeta ligniaria NRRL 30616]
MTDDEMQQTHVMNQIFPRQYRNAVFSHQTLATEACFHLDRPRCLGGGVTARCLDSGARPFRCKWCLFSIPGRPFSSLRTMFQSVPSISSNIASPSALDATAVPSVCSKVQHAAARIFYEDVPRSRSAIPTGNFPEPTFRPGLSDPWRRVHPYSPFEAPLGALRAQSLKSPRPYDSNQLLKT